jgi:uncharacterized protein (DUF1015 family)
VADVRPFRGTHYNESLIQNWSDVICPIFDVITPQMQEELYKKNEFNFIRLEYGRELPQDTLEDSRYTRSAATLEEWLNKHILVDDEKPAIYIYNQSFTYMGRQYNRRGMIARVRVEEWDQNVIRPHEVTGASDKSDRLNLLWALQANTSPIMVLYSDNEQKISSLLNAQEKREPVLSMENIEGVDYTVWAITEPDIIKQISNLLAEQPLYIADGHHRYESALNYRNEMKACSTQYTGNEPYNYTMMTLIEFSDAGLLILPPHRLVRGIQKPILAELMDKIEVFFNIEEIPVDTPDLWKRIDDMLEETNIVRFIMFGTRPDKLLLLELKDQFSVNQMIPYFHSDLYKGLDVSIINHVILENLLAIDKEDEQTKVAYSYDREDTIKRVQSKEYQLAFIIRPVRVDIIKEIADIGDKMPRKSTYFYPKLPAGIVFNRHI